MAEPKKRLTSTRSGNRRAHDRLASVAGAKCLNCGTLIRRHRVCSACGYRGKRKVIEVK